MPDSRKGPSATSDSARGSFAKVAEYQKRGAVHFHAVIRIDGPEGGDTPPPAWATAELLTDAIRAAATAERGAPFRRSTFGRKWRKARQVVKTPWVAPDSRPRKPR